MMNDGLRIVGGILLILGGVVSVVCLTMYPPTGMAAEVIDYLVSFALFAGGFWLILNRGRGSTGA
jgi:hypothetical protein